MTYETTNSDAQVRAAREALRTHDELRRVEQIGDRFELGADQLPVDGRGWLAWHDEQYQPAHRKWAAAMDQLQSVLGDGLPGPHPLSFRTVCEQIIARSTGTEPLEWGVRGPSGGSGPSPPPAPIAATTRNAIRARSPPRPACA